MKEKIREQVEKAIEEIRPHFQADGGDIELVDIENRTAKIRLKGICAGCPMSTMTTKVGSRKLSEEKGA